jgi:hypothetical protein
MFITILMSGQWENCTYYSWNYTQIIILLLKCAYPICHKQELNGV